MRHVLLLPALLLALVLAVPVAAQDEPTATPTLIPVPGQEMFQQLATANAGVSTIGPDLSAPQGAPLLPASDGHEVWGYAKWLMSAASTGELFGPFAPIFNSLGFWFNMSVVLTAIYVTIYGVSYIVRFVLSIFRVIGQNIYVAIIVGVILLIVAIVAFLSTQIHAISDFFNSVGAFFQSVVAWFQEAIHKILQLLNISQ